MLIIFVYIQSRTNVNNFMMASELFGAIPYWRFPSAGWLTCENEMQLNWFQLDLLILCIVCQEEED